MSELHIIKSHPHSKHRRKRVGRGSGSRMGKTSGRGHKGQKQHNKPSRPGFEGGQMPIIRTMPKRGFIGPHKHVYQILNLDDLADIDTKDVINRQWLYEKQYIRNKKDPVKLLGQGEIKKPLQIQIEACSKSARAKLEKAGGRYETVGSK